MGTKDKLKKGQPAFGGWVMIGHPTSAELMAGEGFDWIAVDMEHTPIDLPTFENIARAVKPSGCEVLVRLSSCDPVLTKRVLDAGADGIIVPLVNTRAMAEQAVAMAKYPPDGLRGAAFGRASDFGRNFTPYFTSHNDRVLVVVMLEHVEAVRNADAILSTPGIDAAFIGPYDLSCSMGLPGQLDHPEVQAAQRTILESCRKNRVAPGIHIVPVSQDLVQQYLDDGYQFIACSVDTQFIIHGCRMLLKPCKKKVYQEIK
jgi:2-dehydro-3-deoxyglucarate aldolase